MTKGFNLSEKILKNRAREEVTGYMVIRVRDIKEFIDIILKEHCEWRKELDYDKLVTESFESRVKRIAGEKLY